MQIDALLTTYNVDTAHARHVADLALALYDLAHDQLGMNGHSRRLIEASALLHNVGLTTNPAQHHLVGRDIVLRQPIEDLSADEQAIVAAAVAFHRKRVRPQQEPAFLALGRKKRDLALQVAAVLRVADGLDYSQSQTTRIAAIEQAAAGLAVHLAGPHSASDSQRAMDKADLWVKIFERPLALLPAAAVINEVLLNEPAAGEDAAEVAAERLPPWYGDSGVPLAELCRVLLRRHFRRMLAAERKACQGDDPEAIHELRVATRRIRATLSVAAVIAPPKRLRAFHKAVRQVAQAAGTVRDCDVFLMQVLKEQAALPEEQQATLEPLLVALRADRKQGLASLGAVIRQADYERFKREFAEVIAGPGGLWDEEPTVRDLTGSMIYRQYEVLRAYGPVGLPAELLADDERLHAARIEAKRLRYLLETFEDVFDERVSEAVGPLVAVQDAMGTLNDISVAEHYVATMRLDAAARSELAAYLERRADARPNLLADLAKRWEKISSATYRRALTGLIVKL